MKKKNRKNFIIALSVILLLAYGAAAEIALQTALVPSFMEKLDEFSEFTEKGYGEMVYTEDIVENRKEQLSETAKWVQETDYKKFAMDSDDGLQLIAAGFVQEDPSAPWALMIHGYTGWKEEQYQHAFEYYKQGYSVLLPDLRAHGESEGKYIGLGYLDRGDLLKWMNAIRKLYPDTDWVLYGQSMGGSACVMLAGDPRLPDYVKAVVTDSAFCSPEELFKRKVMDWTGMYDFGIVSAAGLLAKPQAGYSFAEASAIKYAGNIRIPALFIHGSEDKTVLPSDLDKLYNACGSTVKKKLLIEGAGHVQAAEKDPELYYGTIFRFLKEDAGMP